MRRFGDRARTDFGRLAVGLRPDPAVRGRAVHSTAGRLSLARHATRRGGERLDHGRNGPASRRLDRAGAYQHHPGAANRTVQSRRARFWFCPGEMSFPESAPKKSLTSSASTTPSGSRSRFTNILVPHCRPSTARAWTTRSAKMPCRSAVAPATIMRYSSMPRTISLRPGGPPFRSSAWPAASSDLRAERRKQPVRLCVTGRPDGRAKSSGSTFFPPEASFPASRSVTFALRKARPRWSIAFSAE